MMSKHHLLWCLCIVTNVKLARIIMSFLLLVRKPFRATRTIFSNVNNAHVHAAHTRPPHTMVQAQDCWSAATVQMAEKKKWYGKTTCYFVLACWIFQVKATVFSELPTASLMSYVVLAENIIFNSIQHYLREINIFQSFHQWNLVITAYQDGVTVLWK